MNFAFYQATLLAKVYTQPSSGACSAIAAGIATDVAGRRCYGLDDRVPLGGAAG